MVDVFEKRRIRRFFFSRLLTVGVFILLLFLLRAAWGAYQKASFASDGRVDAMQQQQVLQKRSEALQADIDELSTDRGLEAALRSRFDVGREGEQLVVLVDAPNAPAETAPKQGLWQRMRGWFSF